MLMHLHVKNLALIEEIEVDFKEGLNILTGETGAGKSIIIGSVNLALGGKMSRDMIREHSDYALVELVFWVENPLILEDLKKLDISAEDGQIIITRKMTAGRSISKVNGETCTISMIKKIGSLLLDIHGQQEHQSLLYTKKQLSILDKYGKEKIASARQEVKAQYRIYQELKRTLEEYQLDEEQRLREISFLEFEIKEIKDAALLEGEDVRIEKQYKKLANARKIAETLQIVHQNTGYEYGAGGESIGHGLSEFLKVQEYDEHLIDMGSMLTDIDSLLNDFNRELSAYLSELTFSEEEFTQLEARLNLMNHLKTKYGETIAEIQNSLKEKEEKLDKLLHFEENKKELEALLNESEEQLETVSQALSEQRKYFAKELEAGIKKGLLELNFLNVAFEICFHRSNQYTENGCDDIAFMISTNPGEPKKPLDKVVSGGELSRIMLAIKTLLADKDETDTLIFDEIDTGISGRTAQRVSEKMAVISRHHQVLCITHLAQIAAMADAHFVIEKKVENQETTTGIRELDELASVEELSRILGGAQITEVVCQSAKEMKDMAQKQKNTRVK